MFGGEVADVAVGYVIALARHTIEIDRDVRAGRWSKPCGISLAGRTVAIIGYGDIGRNTARRLRAADMHVIAYDPFVNKDTIESGITLKSFPESLGEADFIVVNCALSDSSYHLLNTAAFLQMKDGVRIVNVGRGPVIDEKANISTRVWKGLFSGSRCFRAGTLPMESQLRLHPRCVFCSHNASNTVDVERTSLKALQLLADFLYLNS